MRWEDAIQLDPSFRHFYPEIYVILIKYHYQVHFSVYFFHASLPPSPRFITTNKEKKKGWRVKGPSYHDLPLHPFLPSSRKWVTHLRKLSDPRPTFSSSVKNTPRILANVKIKKKYQGNWNYLRLIPLASLFNQRVFGWGGRWAAVDMAKWSCHGHRFRSGHGSSLEHKKD